MSRVILSNLKRVRSGVLDRDHIKEKVKHEAAHAPYSPSSSIDMRYIRSLYALVAAMHILNNYQRGVPGAFADFSETQGTTGN